MGYWQNHIASVADAKVVAAESIKFQDKKKLAELADVIAKFRGAGDFSPAGYESAGVSDWVFKNIGITIHFKNGSELGLVDVAFAGVEPPKLDANSPIIASMTRALYAGNKDLDMYSKFIKENELNRSIDDSSAKISGD